MGEIEGHLGSLPPVLTGLWAEPQGIPVLTEARGRRSPHGFTESRPKQGIDEPQSPVPETPLSLASAA